MQKQKTLKSSQNLYFTNSLKFNGKTKEKQKVRIIDMTKTLKILLCVSCFIFLVLKLFSKIVIGLIMLKLPIMLLAFSNNLYVLFSYFS